MMPRVVRVDDPDLEFALLEALETSRTIIFPTETVYGIGGNPWDDSVLDRVRRLKGRSPDQPFTLHLPCVEEIDRYAAVDAFSRAIIDRLLPGPYTLLLPALPKAPSSAVMDGVIGVRVPDHPMFDRTLRALERSLFGTSVNRSGEPPLSDLRRIIDAFSNVDLIVEGQVRGTASSILDLTVRPVRVVRGTLPEDLAFDDAENG